MGLARAHDWDNPVPVQFAREIAGIPNLYCGPAVVGWIAAVWNHQRGRPYDHMARLCNKSLFPDGPRAFKSSADLPGFSVYEATLDSILRRETNNELGLASDTMYKYGSIHSALGKYNQPIIIRMMGPDLKQGLHYVALYRSDKIVRNFKTDLIKFSWQDNGYYGKTDGLYTTEWRQVGWNTFKFGAKRVTK